MHKYLGIDVGGSSIKYAIITKNGDILEKGKIKTLYEKEAFLESLVNLINTYKDDIKAVGISFPGLIDINKGVLNTAGALRFMEKFELKSYLQEHTGVVCEIENDAKCVGHAEKWLGNGKDCSDFVCITVGTGIGGAIVINNKVVRGHNFGAGEVGYMLTNGVVHGIGDYFGLSQTSGIFGTRLRYGNLTDSNPETITGEEVFKYDTIASKKVVDRFFESLAMGIFNLIVTLNPQKILVGGAISSDENFLKRLREEVEILKIIPELEYEIDCCKFLNDSGCIGAVKNLMDTISE